MIHHLCQHLVVLGQRFSVPNHTHTHTPIRIHALLKRCALLPSSATWSEHQCDLAVWTLAPEPGSPESVIQGKSVEEMSDPTLGHECPTVMI